MYFMSQSPLQLSILFWLNNQRANNEGKPAIYLRFTLNSKRVELATRLYVDANLWSRQHQKAKGISEEVTEINNQLTIIKADLFRHYNRLKVLEKEVSAEILKDAYLGIGEKEKTLRELLTSYEERFMEKVSSGTKALSTLKSFRTTRDKILAFVTKQFKVSDIPLSKIKISFASDFDHYLTTKDRIGSNTSMKYIKIFKRVLKLAVDQGWMESDPLTGFACHYEEPTRDRLTMEEVMALYKREFKIARLNEVRDVFLFCCFTGYAYQDVANLTPANLEIGIDGEKWIVKNRVKTNNPERIPLLPIALEIVERYKDHPYCENSGKLLPVNTNQRYNGYLKEIADLCGIKKHMTTHMARHTFATSVTLENDVPIETVSQMLGHKSIKTTQIYAKVTQRKVSNNMRDLKNRLYGSTSK
jgi:site-specific recombinase XerD